MTKQLSLMVLPLILLGCMEVKQKGMINDKQAKSETNFLETATFGAGCFWCTEAFFERLEGVIEVKSGYAGGNIENPTYEQVSSGKTGAVEVCKISYDPMIISYEDLLKVFWETHDPTTLNRQGNDIGTQYRSVIFYYNEAQQKIAEAIKAKLDTSGAWDKPIVTTIEPAPTFYAAEDYHQDYFINNPRQPYCQFVIKPKMEKFEKAFADKLK